MPDLETDSVNFFSRYQVIENSVCIVTVAEVAMWRGIPVVAVFRSLVYV